MNSLDVSGMVVHHGSSQVVALQVVGGCRLQARYRDFAISFPMASNLMVAVLEWWSLTRYTLEEITLDSTFPIL